MVTEVAPASAITFLGTNFEGRILRWELCSEALKTALARCDALLR